MWCVMCMHNNNVRCAVVKMVCILCPHIDTTFLHINLCHLKIHDLLYTLLCQSFFSHTHTHPCHNTNTNTHTHTLQHYNKRYYFGNGLLYSISPPSSSPPSYSSKFKPILPPILLDDDDIKLNILSLPLPTLFDKFKN